MFNLNSEDAKLIERWEYAVRNYGAKLTTHGSGRWRLSLDSKKVSQTNEFKEALSKAREIVECHKN